MYKEVSSKWYENIYKNRQSIINVYFDNELINTDYITDFKIGNTLFDKELELGLTPSQYIELQIHKKANIQIPKQVRVEYGILINNDLIETIDTITKDNNSFEIIPIGIYNVDSFDDEDDNIINIKALDNMIKFEFNYDGSDLINQNEYVTISQITQDICNKAGVELRFYFFY